MNNNMLDNLNKEFDRLFVDPDMKPDEKMSYAAFTRLDAENEITEKQSIEVDEFLLNMDNNND